MVKSKTICLYVTECSSYLELLFRLSYAVWMMEQIIADRQFNDQKLYVMYDIACTLSQHLTVRNLSDSSVYESRDLYIASEEIRYPGPSDIMSSHISFVLTQSFLSSN